MDGFFFKIPSIFIFSPQYFYKYGSVGIYLNILPLARHAL